MKLTEKQIAANKLLGGPQQHILLYGGSRSGKTFLTVRAMVIRALAASGSRHAILRFRYNAVKASIVTDTFPKVMKLCFPNVQATHDSQMGLVRFQNGSEIWWGGLDDKERTEKILGQEFVTIFLNEISQIPKSSRDIAVTRLAQNVKVDSTGQPMRRKMFYDENPPTKGHWSYAMFVEGKDPDTRETLPDRDNYACAQMNPTDNLENLPEDYITTLEGLSQRLQKRFLRGEFAESTPDALFPDEVIDRWRVLGGNIPDMQRIVIGVDPSGAGSSDSGTENDAIGICVAGLGTDGNAYIIQDATLKASPSGWGKAVCTSYDRHNADLVVGEINYGGAMVETVIQAARVESGKPRLPFKAVTATRGKVVRAEPISALYEEGRVRHIGYFRPLEDELAGFSTTGYTGGRSPNRADALIWAVTELFPGVVNPRKLTKKQVWEPPVWSA